MSESLTQLYSSGSDGNNSISWDRRYSHPRLNLDPSKFEVAKTSENRNEKLPSHPILWLPLMESGLIDEINSHFMEHGILESSCKRFALYPIGPHLELFVTTLLLWERIPCEKAISKEEVFYRCLNEGPEFAEALKDIRFFSLKKKISLDETGIEDDTDVRDYTSYDSIYNEGNLIHWTEETDDFNWELLPEETDDEFYVLLEDEFTKVVSEIQFERNPSVLEALLEIKNSSGWKDLDPVTSFQVLNAKVEYDFDLSKNYMVGRRLVVQASPAGVRDTAVPDADTLVKIKFNSMALLQICDVLDESAMTRRNLGKRLSKLRRNRMYWMMDIKKCGKTFPRRFLDLMGRVLDAKGVTNYLKDFKTCLLMMEDGEVIETTRGYYLGWCNEAPTILQALIGRIMKHTIDTRLESLFYNDDSCWSMPMDQSELYYASMTGLIRSCYNRAGLLAHEKKDILAGGQNVFCEIYSGFDEIEVDIRKRQVATRLLAKAKLSINRVTCHRFLRDALMYTSDDIYDIAESVVEGLVKKGRIHPTLVMLHQDFGGLYPGEEEDVSLLTTALLEYDYYSEKEKKLSHALRENIIKKSTTAIFDLKKAAHYKNVESKALARLSHFMPRRSSKAIRDKYESIKADNLEKRKQAGYEMEINQLDDEVESEMKPLEIQAIRSAGAAITSWALLSDEDRGALFRDTG